MEDDYLEISDMEVDTNIGDLDNLDQLIATTKEAKLKESLLVQKQQE